MCRDCPAATKVGQKYYQLVCLANGKFGKLEKKTSLNSRETNLKGLSGEIYGGSKVISIDLSCFRLESRRYGFAELLILIF